MIFKAKLEGDISFITLSLWNEDFNLNEKIEGDGKYSILSKIFGHDNLLKMIEILKEYPTTIREFELTDKMFTVRNVWEDISTNKIYQSDYNTIIWEK